MKNQLKCSALLLAALTLTGCQVPATDIQIGTWRLRSPKQVELQNLDIDIKSGKVKIGHLKSVNDATIISSQGQVNVDLIRETRGLVNDIGAITAKKTATGGLAP